jgi:pyruvate dehydrogenase E1 component
LPILSRPQHNTRAVSPAIGVRARRRASRSEQTRMTEPLKLEDLDPVETREWLESIDSVLQSQGPERAHYLLERLIDYTRRSGAYLPFKPNTAYVNTIPTGREPEYPGNRALERRIEAYIRWNALVMVLLANKKSSEYGGHLASYASSATLYEVGFHHFWRAPSEQHPGDMVFIQGHSSPGIYARAFLEGRLSEAQLRLFRQEAGGPGQGLSSYPHPWLMPDFWQFPTVSMGLGPMMAMFQARFTRYLEHRGLVKPSDQKVWAFLGDGEMDEPESMGALTMPVREGLDNLIFVINCNLQRLDGPVRGNGKIIQELEAAFLGAGWNVIKVLWGSRWDPLLARDHKGLLRRVMEECVDGEYQNFKAKGGAYTREHFFGKYPELKAMVANMSDEEIWRLNRGGHDPQKVYAAYAAAATHKGQPTVILAKTVKGYGLGKGGEGQMVAHQQKKLSDEDLKTFRDRFNIPVPDAEVGKLQFVMPAENSDEARYLHEKRTALGGYLPQRRRTAPPLPIPALEAFGSLLEGTGEREISTTMAFVRLLQTLLKDKNIGRNVVPIVPDEARTFGMEGLFRQIGIYSSVGQLYTPQDAETLMSYREDKKGQMIEEGINEAGSLCSWMAAGTAYSNHDINMVPFYIFYSMFGFQRVGDFIWAAGDMQARGFLVGATAGRTTLAGEGLQHQDGHSQLVATTVPNCLAYDPAYAYELAVIIHDGMRRMYAEQESVFYYITVMNENYPQPAMPAGVQQGILNGAYLLQIGGRGKVRATLLGSGTILRECLAAAKILEDDYGIPADVLSVTSFSELRREALECERWNLLHPGESPHVPYVQQLLKDREGPVVAATDYMRTVPDQIRQWVRGRYVTLGTDGFGRSDSRAALRRHFEVDRNYIALAALKALADEGQVVEATVTAAIKALSIDPAKPVPWKV